MTARFFLSRPLRVVAAAALLLMMFASPAAAHDPIFISADQTTPDTGPYMPDGSISWALYGSVLSEGDTRGFEFDLREGDDLVLSFLIPNLAPEIDLTDAELPYFEIEAPDGTVRTILPETRVEYDEPFSRTSYVRLYEETSPGQAGRYRGIVTGNAPARFSLAIGINEIFFTETERAGDRPSSFQEISAPLTAWYSTPPGGEADMSATADGEGAIDLELIEDAMESGEAEAPAGSTDETVTADDAGENAAAATEVPAEPTAVASEPTEVPEAATEAAAEVVSEVAAESADDDGSNLGWVAPVGLGVVVVGAAGAMLARRRSVDT